MAQLNIKAPKLTPYQKDFLYNDARFTIVEASTKVGKTFACIWWLYEQAHQPNVKEGSNFWWISPVYSTSSIAYKRMKRKVAKSNAYKCNETNLTITCPNGAIISFKSADNENTLYGEDVFAAVFDEAPRAKQESWFALRSTLTATQAPCKLIGNFGSSSNWVHLLKDKAKKDPAYAYFKITAYDAVEAGILSLEEVEQAKKDLPESIFRRDYLAEGSGEEGQLIQNESIQKLFTNEVPSGVKYITADIARLGKDKTVVFVWDDLKILEIKELGKSTIPESANLIRELQTKYNVNTANIIVDEDGVGGGVKDLLGCKGFVNNSKALEVKGQSQNFANLKSQCYYKLAEVINSNLIAIPNIDHKVKELLIQELEQVKLPAELDTQRIRILSKDEVKKIIGRSPDYSDTLMMRMYFLLNPHSGTYYLGYA